MVLNRVMLNYNHRHVYEEHRPPRRNVPPTKSCQDKKVMLSVLITNSFSKLQYNNTMYVFLF
jgi:hypothetical protein